MRNRILGTISVLCMVVGLAPPAKPCSRVVWNDNGNAVVVGRTLDWFKASPFDLYQLPRGIKREGLTGKNTLTWTAKYGTIATVMYGDVGGEEVGGTSDGINEKGLSGGLLYLAESDYGKYDPTRPSLSLGLWLQYYLDNFATVKEAVEFTEKTQPQLVTAVYDGRKAGMHLALTDPTGDTVVLEYLGGQVKIHHGKQYTVMTNSPPYDAQLDQLKQYKGFGGEKGLPGTTQAADRFVRGAYYLNRLPKPETNRQCIASILSVVRNISAPFGASDPSQPNVSPTRWRTVADLTNLVYYFESTTSPNLIWVKVREVNFAAGSGIRKLDLIKKPDRIGDNTKLFEKAKPFTVGKPDLG